MNTYESKFSIGDRVWIDGDKGIEAIVISIVFFMYDYEVNISWIEGGSITYDTMPIWRLKKVI